MGEKKIKGREEVKGGERSEVRGGTGTWEGRRGAGERKQDMEDVYI